MPHDAPYNLFDTTDAILEILRNNGVSAVFFAVGQLVEDAPELISKVAREGHAIGLHGYRHEHLDLLSPSALSTLKVELAQVSKLVEQLTGTPPKGFRAPYLLGPKFTHTTVSEMLFELGFIWTSNREVRFAEELFRSDRIPWDSVRHIADATGAFSDTRPLGIALLTALNTRHLWHDSALGLPTQRLHWLLNGRIPYRRADLIEVALGAPLDCDLLGLPVPTEYSSEADLAFATECLINGANRNGHPYVLTFHDWIVGSANRPAILQNVLQALREKGSMLDAKTWVPMVGGHHV